MSQSHFILGMFLAGLTVPGANVATGQDYPTKPIRITTGSVGGGNDFAARQIAQGISGPLGQPVIVDNRPPLLLGEIGAKLPPDGYNVVIYGRSVWILPLLQKVPYDMARDFTAVSLISRDVSMVAVHPSLPVKSVKELIAFAKARPGELNYGSDTLGSTTHLAVELFKSMAGVNLVRVSYKGIATVITGLVGGEVHMTIIDASLVAPQAKSGRLRALAVTSATPSTLFPSLPTVASAGLPGYESVGMTIMLAPAKTPAAIIARLNQEIVRALNQPEVKERYLNAGVELVASSPQQLAAALEADMSRMGKVIRDNNLRFD